MNIVLASRGSWHDHTNRESKISSRVDIGDFQTRRALRASEVDLVVKVSDASNERIVLQVLPAVPTERRIKRKLG